MYTGVDTVYLIHHSHTDIGFTHDQPIVWDLHRRFLDMTLDECERHAGRDADDSFRWTVETTLVLLEWLRTAPTRQVERFLALERARRIEVTAMPVNITPLFDTGELIEALEPVRMLRRDYGLTIHNAMNSDVNGQNWPVVDALLDAGIEGLSMATNIHFGGSPLAWPNAFRWQGPSGRSILAWNGWDYFFAYDSGIDASLERFRDEGWPRIERWLRERAYPLPGLMLQLYDRFGDNGPPSTTISAFVRQWNETVGRPRLRLALPAEWWAMVREHAGDLPTHRGDWTDYWNFGCGSSAREVAVNRASRSRLRVADAAASVVEVLGGEAHPARTALAGTREQASKALFLWDEHTWGAGRSVSQPDDDDTVTQWYHKAAYAHTARSLSQMLQRDALANLARHVSRDADDACLLFNLLPWARQVAGPVPESQVRVVWGRLDDPSAARHWADYGRTERPAPDLALASMDVPAFGYTVVPAAAIHNRESTSSEEAIVETPYHRVEFDLVRGGIRRWFSKRLGREMVDSAAEWPLAGWVHEAPVVTPDPANPRNARRAFWAPVERRLGLERGWRPGWAAERVGPRRVLSHTVSRRDDALEVEQRLELPGGGELVQTTVLPAAAEWLECMASWPMGLNPQPEATYLAFPLLAPDAVARLDLGGQAIRVDADQLPRACRDYYTVQGWVDLSNEQFGVTVACPDAPMIQLGDFTFGANQETAGPRRALLLGWVTNNYWETNFRAHQPGLVSARYRLLPHAGPFDEASAHRHGLEAAQPVLVQPLGEPVADGPLLPRSGTLLQLPASPVLTLRVWSETDHLLLRLLNASDVPVEAVVGSGLLRIGGAQRGDLFGDGLQEVAVIDGRVRIMLGPRGLATLRLAVAPAAAVPDVKMTTGG